MNFLFAGSAIEAPPGLFEVFAAFTGSLTASGADLRRTPRDTLFITLLQRAWLTRPTLPGQGAFINPAKFLPH
jgi:hypothetical protein